MHRLLTFLLFAPILAFARPVAVIINFGDQSDQRKQMDESAKRAQEFYRKNYDVRIIHPSENIRQKIEQTFQALDTYDKLDIVTIGHGTNNDPLTKTSPSFPAQKIPTDLQKLRSNGSFVFQNEMAPMMAMSGPEAQAAGASSARDMRGYTYGVGVGDFAKWIAQGQKKNPKAPVTIHMGECHSGLAARYLNQLPGVQAFSATSDIEMSHFKNIGGRKKVFSDLLFDEMEKAQAETPEPKPIEVFDRARKNWVAIPQMTGGEYPADVPWSPIDAHINEWCTHHSQSKETNSEPLSPELLPAKESADRSLTFLAEMDRKRFDKLGCLSHNKIDSAHEVLRQIRENIASAVERSKQKLLTLTFSEFKTHSQSDRDNFPDVVDQESFDRAKSSVIAQLDDLKRCFQESSRPCKDGTLLGKLRSIMRDMEVKQRPAVCDSSTDQVNECLNWLGRDDVKEKHANFALAHITMIAMNAWNFLDQCNDKNRIHYYTTCYERFWREADQKTRRALQSKVTGNETLQDSNTSGAVR